jgi:transcriptional regulator GlxA family with amidase domain
MNGEWSAQFSHMLSHQTVTSNPLRELQVWMLENLREELTVEKLADRLGMSPRAFHACMCHFSYIRF